MFSDLACYILAMVYLGLTPSKLATEDYGSTLLLLELYLLILALGISAILQPWQRIVFDRVSRTVTIPGRLLLHKKKPYLIVRLNSRFVITWGVVRWGL